VEERFYCKKASIPWRNTPDATSYNFLWENYVQASFNGKLLKSLEVTLPFTKL
jgi:hypothetical protein